MYSTGSLEQEKKWFTKIYMKFSINTQWHQLSVLVCLHRMKINCTPIFILFAELMIPDPDDSDNGRWEMNEWMANQSILIDQTNQFILKHITSQCLWALSHYDKIWFGGEVFSKHNAYYIIYIYCICCMCNYSYLFL